MPVISAVGRLRLEHHCKMEASMYYMLCNSVLKYHQNRKKKTILMFVKVKHIL